MSSNPEKCGRAGGWEERPRGGGGTSRSWEREGGRKEALAGGQGLPAAPSWAPTWARYCQGSAAPAPPARTLGAATSLPAGPAPSVPVPPIPAWPLSPVPPPPASAAPRCHLSPRHAPGATPESRPSQRTPLCSLPPRAGGPRWLVAGTWPRWDQVLCRSPAPGAHGVPGGLTTSPLAHLPLLQGLDAAGDVLGSRARTQSVFPPPQCPHLLPPRGRGRSSFPGTGRVKGWLEHAAAHLLMGSCQEKHKGGGRPLPRALRGQVLPLVPTGRLGSPSCFPSPSCSRRKAPRPLRGEQPLSQVPASVLRPQPRAQRSQPRHQTEGIQRGAEASAAKARNLRAALERGRKGLLKVFLIKGSAVEYTRALAFLLLFWVLV